LLTDVQITHSAAATVAALKKLGLVMELQTVGTTLMSCYPVESAPVRQSHRTHLSSNNAKGIFPKKK